MLLLGQTFNCVHLVYEFPHVGTPQDPKFRNLPSSTTGNNGDWQDPDLIRDLEAATGINLTMPKAKKAKKNSQLTNIKEKQNTVRKRLEKKVFNKSSMKRVAQDLNLTEKYRK